MSDPEARMPLTGHLEELRSRLLRCLGALAAALVPAWWFRQELLDLVLGPLKLVMASRGLQRLAALDAGDTFLVHLLLALLGALLLASPLLLWQLWAFVAPAFPAEARRRLRPVLLLMPLLALLGLLFAHRVVLPFMLDFFIDFSQSGDTNLLLGIRGVFSTAVVTLLVFGLTFQLPILMMALSAAGLVPGRIWSRGVRFMIPGSLIIGAILTPPDVFSQLLLAGPIMVLYLLGTLMARLAAERGLAPVAGVAALLLLPALPLLLLPGPLPPVATRLPPGEGLLGRLSTEEGAQELLGDLFAATQEGLEELWLYRRGDQTLAVLEGSSLSCRGLGGDCLEFEGRLLLGSRELGRLFEARARSLASPLTPFFLGQQGPGLRGVLQGGQAWRLERVEGALQLAFPGLDDCAAATRLLDARPDPRTRLLLALAGEAASRLAREDAQAARDLEALQAELAGPSDGAWPGALAGALGGVRSCQVLEGAATLVLNSTAPLGSVLPGLLALGATPARP